MPPERAASSRPSPRASILVSAEWSPFQRPPSPMDLQSRSRWLDYSRAKDEMFAHCDIKQAPWYVVNADDKKRARLNCISHLLGLIPYKDLTPDVIELPPRQADTGYVRPPLTD